MKEVIRFFDCFAGIGGFYCGANQIKSDEYELRHVAYCEIDKSAQRFYDVACSSDGIQKIQDVKDIKTKKNPAGIEVVDFDILFAGFPCQSFSNVGYRKGFDDPRGQLFFYILDILDYYRPKYFVLENVQKIHTIKNGSLLDEMKAALRDIGGGYILHTWDLLASDYGLPQKRNRIFFCGIRKDLSDAKDISEPPVVDLKTAKYPTTWHLLEKGAVDPKHYIPQGSRKIILTKPSNWEGDVTIDNPIARPLTATMAKWHRANQDNYFSKAYISGNDPYNRPCVDMETEPIRRITPLEGFRLQGFPDRYAEIATELGIAYSTQYKLIGNALPVDLARSVIEHFLNSYLSYKEDHAMPENITATIADGFERYCSVLKNELSYVEDGSFSWDDAVGLLIIQLRNTDSLNKTRRESHATQIQLTSEREATEGTRKTEDFFPTLTLNPSFKSWRISIPARVNLRNVEQLGGAAYTSSDPWHPDSIQIRRRLLNDDGQGNGNPALQICYGDDLMPLREQLNVDDYLVIVKRKSVALYDAFGVKSTVDLGRGKNMYLSARASTDSTSFMFDGLMANYDTVERLSGGTSTLLYGVPGSGKSWTIEHEYCHAGSVVERLVFHPDYTNADFIGQILPVVDAEKQVTYEFTPGPFTTILRDAYTHPMREYVLIIEEVNRGNAPAIFGEAFQLLDRTVEPKTVEGITYPVGTSEYSITHKYMAEKIYGDPAHKVRIPSNLSIIGTMNTSDQNVFTLDTAFQRRWGLRLIENSFDNVRASLANAQILDTEVTWKTFCEKVNGIIAGNKAKMASAEDKRLGVYFVHERDLAFDQRAVPSDGYTSLLTEYNDLRRTESTGDMPQDKKQRLVIIREALMHNRMFPEKVIKYLWDDAFKFNPEALFDTDNMESLEQVIRTFVYSRGRERFNIFKPTVRALLYPDTQAL